MTDKIKCTCDDGKPEKCIYKIRCPCDDGESEKCICQHRAGENFDNYYPPLKHLEDLIH